jgi:Ca2+-binding RTX toxin-like protein
MSAFSMSSLMSRLFRKPRVAPSRRLATACLRMETLETREVPAAQLTARLSVADGVLRVEGTEQSDLISVAQHGGLVSVGGATITVTDLSGATTEWETVPEDMVASVRIDALGGDDFAQMYNLYAERPHLPATIDGGDGNDSLYGGLANDVLIGGTGDDLLVGDEGNDILIGGDGIDNLYGNAGDDSLDGGEGDDGLVGGTGADSLFGGGGNDFLAGGDNDAGTPLDGADHLNGGAGDDTLLGEGGADVLRGESGTDTLDGGDGNDILYGGAGDDALDGGAGNDWLHGDDPNLFVSGGSDTLRGGIGNDTLTGGIGADDLDGGDGDDTLYGGAGNDTLAGGLGSDTLYGDGGNDVLLGAYLGTTTDTGMNTLYGGAGNDVLRGGDRKDWLYGGTGTDSIYGNGGDDWMDAGSAAEFADGGAGYDFNAYVTAVNGAQYTDIVQGGSPTCWILASMGSMANSGVDLSQRITYVGGNTYRVDLYNRIDPANPMAGYVLRPEYVTFDGSLRASDPGRPPNQEGESWVTILQRAIIQAVSRFDPSQNLDTPHSGGARDPLAILTGKWVNDDVSPASFPNAGALGAQIAAGKLAVAHTLGSGTTTLVAGHAYTVVGTTGGHVWLWNPWGELTAISWEAFKRDVGAIALV